jgi:flagellar motor switch protein FliN/FliY
MTNNKDYLSQEEIDELLRQSSEDEDIEILDSDINVDFYFNSMEKDTLGEIGNITYGSAATALSTLLGKKVEITTPKVSAVSRSKLEDEFPKPHVAVDVKYVQGFQGINLLVIQTSDAKVIADLMLGGDGTSPAEELSEIHLSAVQEAMNQMMGSSATSMSTLFNRFVNISPPGIDVLNFAQGQGADRLPTDHVLIKVSFRLIIGDLIDSSIMQLLTVDFAREMIDNLMNGGEQNIVQPAQHATPQRADVAAPTPAQAAQQPVHPRHDSQQPAYAQPSTPASSYHPPQQPQAQYQQPAPEQGGASYGPVNHRNVKVQPVQYTNFSNVPAAHGDESNLNLLLDIPLRVTVELGRTKKLIKDILELSQGSIIELDKLAGEPVDILVNNKLIAKGEVVVVDENFGVRVTDIVSQWDRIQKLQ